MIRPDDRLDPGRRPNEPVHPDKLDTEGPLATKWGTVWGGASQRSLWSWIAIWVVRIIAAPYVLVYRSRWPVWAKGIVIVALAAVYGLLWASVALIPMPR